MTLFNYILDNNFVFYGLFSTTAGILGYLYMKSYFNSTLNQTPNSPQTFNFTLDQLKEIEDTAAEASKTNISPEQLSEANQILDRGEPLPQELQDKLDEDLQNIKGEELYTDLQRDLLQIQNDFENNLQNFFENLDSVSNSGLDYTTILQIVDIISNLISPWF